MADQPGARSARGDHRRGPHQPYRFGVITGHVGESTRDGADAHIDRLATKYLGQDRYPFRHAGERRVLFRVRPDHVRIAGGAH